MPITKLGAGAERAVECHMWQEASPSATRVPGDDFLARHHMVKKEVENEMAMIMKVQWVRRHFVPTTNCPTGIFWATNCPR